MAQGAEEVKRSLQEIATTREGEGAGGKPS
jgi:hypothetical protein